MGPPRLKDTGERLEAIEDELSRDRTPGIGTMYDVAEAVVGRMEPQHMRNCVKDGPVCDTLKRLEKLEKEMDDIHTEQRRHEDFINQYLGEKNFKRYIMPILIGFLGSSAGAAIVTLALRSLLGK